MERTRIDNYKLNKTKGFNSLCCLSSILQDFVRAVEGTAPGSSCKIISINHSGPMLVIDLHIYPNCKSDLLIKKRSKKKTKIMTDFLHNKNK